MTQNNVGIYASQISGHLWAPEGAYDSLATVTVPSGGVATVTFAGIPSGYKHLQLRGFINVSTGNNPAIRFNSDSASNYSRHGIYGDGSSALAFGTTSTTFIGIAQALGLGTNKFGGAIVDILDYSSVNKNKTVRIFTGFDANGVGGVELDSGTWYNSGTAINTITLTSQTGVFNEYSSFALYGVK